MMTGGPDPVRRQAIVVPSKDSNEAEDSEGSGTSTASGMPKPLHDRPEWSTGYRRWGSSLSGPDDPPRTGTD
jgi:hypothetical protein